MKAKPMKNPTSTPAAKPFTRRQFQASLAALPLLALAPLARAHGDAHGKKDTPASKDKANQAPAEQKAWGIAGRSTQVGRTVELRMSDDMRFSPDTLTVKQGETLRIVAINDGKVMHEFVLGTDEELNAHAALMKKFPNMEHDEPYMTHVPPGQRGEVIWHFNRPGTFGFACLIAGHFEAGMRGTLTVA
ncbi:cupredoxin family protein [Hydrogenophaga sp. 5NK40-0174]